jgi:hypothetical protein
MNATYTEYKAFTYLVNLIHFWNHNFIYILLPNSVALWLTKVFAHEFNDDDDDDDNNNNNNRSNILTFDWIRHKMQMVKPKFTIKLNYKYIKNRCSRKYINVLNSPKYILSHNL